MAAWSVSTWFWTLSLVFSPAHWLSDVPGAPLHASRLEASQSRLLTPEVSKYISDLQKISNITGLTVGVVSLHDNITEFGAWGVRTEDGDPMTADVRIYLSSVGHMSVVLKSTFVTDCFLPGFMFESHPISLNRTRDGQLRYRKERDCSSSPSHEI